MYKIFRTIGLGIALGAALFFVPGIFTFVLAAMVFGIALILIFRSKRRRRFMHRFADFDYRDQQIIPIDNQWYRPAVSGNSPGRDINING